MAILATDLKRHLSGGAGNADPNASIGGAISSTEIVDAALHNLFDQVSGDESAAGNIEYRCIYLANNHATLTWESVKVWIGTETPSADSAIDIGLDPAGIGDGSATGVAATPGDESTAPAGVAFSHVLAKADGLAVGDIAAGSAIAIWLRRTISAGASAFNNDAVIVSFEGETAA